MKAEPVFSDGDTNFICVLRGLFPAEALRRARLDYHALEAGSKGPSLNKRAEIQGVAADVIRLDKRWYEPWLQAELVDFLALSQGFDQLTFPPQLRHVRESGHFVPWHQDIAYQLSMGPRGHKEVATCFIPLDDEPSRHTTLEFALKRGELPRPHFDAGIFQNALKDASFEETAAFDLKLGDALFFGALIPHRTFQQSGKERERTSLEFRLARKSAVIPGKDYLDLNSKTFYVAQERAHGKS